MRCLLVALLFIFFKKVHAERSFFKTLTPVVGAFSFSPAIDTKSIIQEETENNDTASLMQTGDRLYSVRLHSSNAPGLSLKSTIDYDTEALQKAQRMEISIEGIVQGSTTKFTKDTESDELPQGPSPAKEKELKARSKGGFMGDKSSSASEAFSNANLQVGGIGADQSIRDDKKMILKYIASNAKPEKVTKEDMEEIMGMHQTLTATSDILRDYSVPCPLEFFAVSTQCRATDVYKGPCARIQNDLYKLSHLAKASWAKSCGVDWPPLPDVCKNGTNYHYACPVGWISVGKGFCQNLKLDDSGKCLKKAQLGFMSQEEKQEFEKQCDVRWPCRSSNQCKKNFNAICPRGWKYLGDFLCAPPTTYTGPCKGTTNLEAMEGHVELKVNFELKCFVEWPCYSYACERDYEAACPLGWSKLMDNSCKAPFTFATSDKCPGIVKFSNFQPEDRQSFAAFCEVDFPCKDRRSCKMDFSSRCPIDWSDLGDGKMCQAPKNYKGRHCDSVINFADMSEEEKQAKAVECLIEWPCIREWHQAPINVHI